MICNVKLTSAGYVDETYRCPKPGASLIKNRTDKDPDPVLGSLPRVLANTEWFSEPYIQFSGHNRACGVINFVVFTDEFEERKNKTLREQ